MPNKKPKGPIMINRTMASEMFLLNMNKNEIRPIIPPYKGFLRPAKNENKPTMKIVIDKFMMIFLYA